MELFSANVLKNSGKELKKTRVPDEEIVEQDDVPTKTITIATKDDSVSQNALVSASSRDNTTSVAFSFAELGIADWLCQTTASLGYKRPTIVQSSCIPGILQGKDVMACAETGSGKTATFVLPMLQILAQDPYGIFGVILTPTRELALQISEQITALGASLQVTTALVIGGMNMIHQALQLSRRPHFVIATPGRLRAHLEGAEPPNIRRARFLVLDEADRLLALGFASELAVILQHINPKRQTLLFSATLTHTLDELQTLALRDGATLRHNSTIQQSSTDAEGHPVTAGGHHGRQLPATLTQQYLVVPAKLKLCYLVLLLSKFFSPPSTSTSEDTAPSKKKKDSVSQAEPSLSLAEAIASKKTRDDYKHQHHPKNAPYDAGKLHLPHKKHLKSNQNNKNNTDSMAFVEQLLRQNAHNKSSSNNNNGRLSQVIIFVESCTRCHELSLTIQELLRVAHRRGFSVFGSESDNNNSNNNNELCCVALHGMMTQSQRVQNLQAFRDVTARILIATDVASRGLDMQAVDWVISYDLPRVAADYVHRAGRTARAGRRGVATTMVTPHDIALLQAIEATCDTRLVAREDIDIAETQPLLLPVSKAVQTVQLAILASDFKEKEERFKERKKEQKLKEQRRFGNLMSGEDSGTSDNKRKKAKDDQGDEEVEEEEEAENVTKKKSKKRLTEDADEVRVAKKKKSKAT